jgi:hypothetical protein
MSVEYVADLTPSDLTQYRSGLFGLSPSHPQHTQDRQHEKGRRHDKDEVIVAATPFRDVAVDRRPGRGCQLGGDVIQPRVGPQIGVGGRGVHHHW